MLEMHLAGKAKTRAFSARQIGNASKVPERGIYGTKSEKLTKQANPGPEPFSASLFETCKANSNPFFSLQLKKKVLFERAVG